MPKNTSFGIAAFILSIFALFFLGMPYLGLPMAILAVVFYTFQRKEGATRLAKTGLILGIVGVVLNLVTLLVLIGVMSLMGFVMGSAQGVEITVVENDSDLNIDAKVPQLEDTIETERIIITINKEET